MIKLINREGSKFRYANTIIALFPQHDCYIEPFFGTGAIYFNKPLAKYNLLNDRSEFIYNLFNTIKNDGWHELYDKVKGALVYDRIIEENIDKFEYQIIRQINSIYNMGSNSISMGLQNPKEVFLNRLKSFGNKMLGMLAVAKIVNKDVFDFLDSMHLRRELDRSVWDHSRSFAYCDPPYSISKGGLKDNKGWNIGKLEQLIQWFKNKHDGSMKFAISEYSDKQVIELFKSYNLYITEIKRSTGIAKTQGHNKFEILATSYPVQNTLFNII